MGSLNEKYSPNGSSQKITDAAIPFYATLQIYFTNRKIHYL